MWLWKSFLTSQSFSFLLCEMRIKKIFLRTTKVTLVRLLHYNFRESEALLPSPVPFCILKKTPNAKKFKIRFYSYNCYKDEYNLG